MVTPFYLLLFCTCFYIVLGRLLILGSLNILLEVNACHGWQVQYNELGMQTTTLLAMTFEELEPLISFYFQDTRIIGGQSGLWFYDNTSHGNSIILTQDPFFDKIAHQSVALIDSSEVLL